MNSCCEQCVNYAYDDEYECWSCLIDLDEDELQRFMSYSVTSCPYYKNGDEYTIVRKQN